MYDEAVSNFTTMERELEKTREERDGANAEVKQLHQKLAAAQRQLEPPDSNDARTVFERAARMLGLDEADRKRLLDFSRYVS